MARHAREPFSAAPFRFDKECAFPVRFGGLVPIVDAANSAGHQWQVGGSFQQLFEF